MSDQLMENKVGFELAAEPMTPACPNGQLYTVRSGDTMFFIARRFNISLQQLINANPQISDPNTIFPGQIICIPVPSPTVPCPSGQAYRVVRGDTMFEIARRFGVSLDALIAANPQISDPNLIFPGQEICIPSPRPVPCPNGTLYTVKSGDTMFEIARANNISLSVLIMANPQISDPNLIFPGQVICVPRPVMEVPIEMPVPLPMPMPLPAPAPIAPIPQPCPPMPMPPVMPPMAPCPPGHGMMYPMPVYIVVPWDECPYRHKKKKHERREHRCH